MKKILLADAHIPDVKAWFSKNFDIYLYQNQDEFNQLILQAEILLCRSTIQINEDIIKQSKLELIATATSGSDHIDLISLKQKNIIFFDAKGGNAPAVRDYMLATIAYLETHQYIQNPRIAIIGFGYVGSLVSQSLLQLGYRIGTYDPFIPKTPHCLKLDDLKHYDLICLHPHYHKNMPYPSHHFIDSKILKTLKSNICIINAARGHVVDEQAVLDSSFKGIYCTDVYENEPNICPGIVKKATICTPHIAGHSIHSKQRLTKIIAGKIHLHYQLPFAEKDNEENMLRINDLNHWQKQILEIYNPIHETQELKNNPSSEHFIALRSAHKFRNEIKWEI